MRAYLKHLFVGIVVQMLVVIAMNVTIDPYGWYGSPRYAGFNAIKPYIAGQLRLAKPQEIARVRPRTIVLGNSRTEIGFNPDSAAFPGEMRPVYNLSMPGSSLAGLTGLLKTELNRGELRTLIVGLDFIDFPIDQRARVIAPEPVQNRTAWLQDFIAATLSIDATLHSLGTILNQRPGVETRTDHGFSPAAQMPPIVALEGHATMFRQADGERAQGLKRMPHNLHTIDGGSPSFDALERLIADCAERQVRLILFVPPYHAYILQQFDQFGLLPTYAAWKRELAARVAEAASRNAGGPALELWDFGFYNAVTTEDVPARAGQQMEWYWEAGHYKASLGERMLSQMLDGTDSEIGYRMTPRALEKVLTEQPKAAEAYRMAHPEIVSYLAQMQ